MIITDIWIKSKEKGLFKDMIFSYNRECFQNIGNYIQLGTSGMLMVCLEWWALEFLDLYAGIIGVESLAAYVVQCQIVCFIFQMA